MLATFGTGNEAVAGADMAMAAKVEHVIHNADGTISECRSHGNDPYPPSGAIWASGVRDDQGRRRSRRYDASAGGGLGTCSSASFCRGGFVVAGCPLLSKSTVTDSKPLNCCAVAIPE